MTDHHPMHSYTGPVGSTLIGQFINLLVVVFSGIFHHILVDLLLHQADRASGHTSVSVIDTNGHVHSLIGHFIG